jgi:cytochrome c biogenesis protein
MASLFIRARRIWVRAAARDGRTVVELAGLDRSSGGDLADEVDELHRAVLRTVDERETQESTPS